MDDSDFDGSPELGASAPNNPVRQSESDSMTPSFLHTPSKAENDASRPAHLGPAADLKKSEDAAAKNGAGEKATGKEGAASIAKGAAGDKAQGATGSAKLAEKMGAATPMKFLNKVTGKKGKTNQKGFMKKTTATIFTFMALTGGLAGFSLFGQTMQGFSYVNNLIKNFDRSSFSMHNRVVTTLRSVLKENKKATPELQTNLKQVGVEVDTDEAGNVKGYEYDGGDGTVKKITDVAELDAAMDTDTKFSSKVAKSSEIINTQTTYGEVKTTAAQRIGWDKNRFSEYDSDDADTRTSTNGEFEEIAAGEKHAYVGEGKSKYHDKDGNEISEDEYYKLDEESRGKIETEIKEDDVGEVKSKADYEAEVKNIADYDEDTGELKVGKKVEAEIEKHSSTGVLGTMAKTVSTGACLFAKVGTAVAAITIGKQIMNAINLASGYLEATQKCQAGDGTCRSMHDYQNRTNSGAFWSSVSIQSVFGSSTAKTQSAGIGNLENIFTNGDIVGALTAAQVSMTAWKACTYSQLIAQGLDAIEDVGSTILAFVTGGFSLLVKSVAKAVIFSMAVEAAVKYAVGKVVDYAIEALGIDEITDMAKAIGGDYTTMGSKKILSTMGQSVGHSTATAEKVAEFSRYANEVVALRAEYDRDNLSPFDASSPYTFIGTIVDSLSKFSVLNSANSSPIMRIMNSASSVVSSSIASLLPQAAASPYYDSASTPGNCPITNNIGAAADANNCFPYYIADVDSFGISYESAVDNLCGREVLKCEDGNTKVAIIGAEEPDIKEFVVYSTQRDVHPGLEDANIAAEDHILQSGNDKIDSFVSKIPGIGSAIDSINAGIDANNAGKIFGSDYVIGGENWEKEENKKLYTAAEAYMELDTVYTQLGLIENSAVADFLDDYYDKNPIDNSYEGTLARFSGLTKEEVSNTLAYMDYIEAVNEYQPAVSYVFGAPTEKPIVVNDGDSHQDGILKTEITYYDLRSLNFVA